MFKCMHANGLNHDAMKVFATAKVTDHNTHMGKSKCTVPDKHAWGHVAFSACVCAEALAGLTNLLAIVHSCRLAEMCT
eukprot:353218-Karenia_brevis.AAC.1